MISVVIPAFNEAGNIPRFEGELITILHSLDEEHEILVVDDGSSDDTSTKVRDLMKKYLFVRLCEHDRNRGLGCAIRTGIDNARGDLLIALDADFTFHPREISKLVERFRMGDVDCVIGSHFSPEGRVRDVHNHRVLLSRVVNILYSILLGGGIKSTSSIFRLYKTDQLREMHLSSEGFDINAEILFNLINSNRKVVEVPVTLATRAYGKSKLNVLKEIKNHLILLGKILLWRFKAC